jgi:hypothetical protein
MNNSQDDAVRKSGARAPFAVKAGAFGTFQSNRMLKWKSNGDLSMPRELIEPHKGDKRYVRRKKGKFSSRQTEVGRSLSADRRSKAKTIMKKGEGDRGDQAKR